MEIIVCRVTHPSVKTVSELSSTTHHYYNADSCGLGVNDNNSSSSTNNSNNNTASGGGGSNNKELMMDTASCQNDSDEDVIVDDDDTVKVSSKINYSKVQRRQEEQNVGSSR